MRYLCPTSPVARLLLLLLVVPLAGCGGQYTAHAPAAVAVAPVSVDTAALTVAQRLQQDVKMLSQTIGDRRVGKYANLSAAADYLATRFTSAGYVVTRQSFTAGGKTVSNIVANPPSPALSKPLVLVGAHYDTDANPGADDNASGVAMVLELARLLKNKTTNSRVRYVAFVNEEDPYGGTSQGGSVVCAKALVASGESVRGVVNFDMAGYFPAGKKFFYVGAEASAKALGDRAQALFGAGTTMPIRRMSATDEDLPYCDNGYFTDRGFKAVLFCAPGFYLNPNWHESTDTWDDLSYEDMASAVAGMRNVVARL